MTVLLQVGTAGSVHMMKTFLDGKKMCVIYCKYNMYLSVLFPTIGFHGVPKVGKRAKTKEEGGIIW